MLQHLHGSAHSVQDKETWSSVQASHAAGAPKRQRKGPSWADDSVDDEPSKTIFDDWDDYVKV